MSSSLPNVEQITPISSTINDSLSTSNSQMTTEAQDLLSSITNHADPSDVSAEIQATESSPRDALLQGPSQAARIRGQVEYYLSDENLTIDWFLRDKLKAKSGQNQPLSISMISSFKKMRKFGPLSAVIDALRESDKLNVVKFKGEECVVRKVPFLTEGKSKASKKTKSKPTGFEEYWADAPITPAEFAEEEEIYDPDRLFAERIETAFQKYKSKRRMDNRTAEIYTKWVKFGGIDTGPKQFSGGLGGEDLENKSAAEIASLTATEFVSEDKYDLGEDSKWFVDFEGLAKGFLSSIVPIVLDPSTEPEIKKCVNVLRNFYNYILHHNVCPEYNESIYAARKVCDIADHELSCTNRAVRCFPGRFNMACSTLFGGHYKRMYAADKEWNMGHQATQVKVGMSDKEARQVVSMALAAYGADELFTGQKDLLAMRQHFEQTIVDTEQNVGLEVTAIAEATPDIREFYQGDMGGQFGILGRLHCKPWTIPGFESYDLPANYVPPPRPESYLFLVEKEVLDCCFVGMKLETSVYTLSSGMKFFDNVLGVYCSFYTFLENELVRRWKEPKIFTREELLEKDKAHNEDDDEIVAINGGEAAPEADQVVDGVLEATSGIDQTNGGDPRAAHDDDRMDGGVPEATSDDSQVVGRDTAAAAEDNGVIIDPGVAHEVNEVVRGGPGKATKDTNVVGGSPGMTLEDSEVVHTGLEADLEETEGGVALEESEVAEKGVGAAPEETEAADTGLGVPLEGHEMVGGDLVATFQPKENTPEGL